MNLLATSLEAVTRHPQDPDELPATHAWRQLVTDVVDSDEPPIVMADGERWTRSKLAKAAGTSSSQILKLLNGSTKASPLVRRINEVLGIPFLEPQPITREQAEIIEMLLKVDDLDWLTKTIGMVAQKKH